MRLVVLNWAVIWLSLSLEEASQLIAVVAIGIAIGALIAGRYIPLRQAFSVMWAGVAMGVLVMGMLWVHSIPFAAFLMFLVGVLSGFFVVPLNAMLQHRGQKLMGAGHSIAVQNFNENLGILVMVGLHGLLVRFLSGPVPDNASEMLQQQFGHSGMPPMFIIIIGFGAFVVALMLLIIMRYRHGLAKGQFRD